MVKQDMTARRLQRMEAQDEHSAKKPADPYLKGRPARPQRKKMDSHSGAK